MPATAEFRLRFQKGRLTFTLIAKNFMLYCRLIYMLSMLYVRLTIKVKVGIPESFKVGWYRHKITGSSHLKLIVNWCIKQKNALCKSPLTSLSYYFCSVLDNQRALENTFQATTFRVEQNSSFKEFSRTSKEFRNSSRQRGIQGLFKTVRILDENITRISIKSEVKNLVLWLESILCIATFSL